MKVEGALQAERRFGGLDPDPQHEPMDSEFEPPTVAFEHARQPNRTGKHKA